LARLLVFLLSSFHLIADKHSPET